MIQNELKLQTVGATPVISSRRILKTPTDLGGTVLPGLHAYYQDAQLSHHFHFNKEDKLGYLILACSAAPTQVAHPFQILFIDSHNLTKMGGCRGLVYYHHCRIWALALRQLKASPIQAHTPLWDHFNLPERLTLPDNDLWINQGVIYLPSGNEQCRSLIVSES